VRRRGTVVKRKTNNPEVPGSNPSKAPYFSFLFLLLPFFKQKTTTSTETHDFAHCNQFRNKSNMLPAFLLLDWRRYSGNRAADAGKLVKLDHLEEVKVVTRFP